MSSSSFFLCFQVVLGALGVLALFLILFALTALILKRKRASSGGKVEIKYLNDKYKEDKQKFLQEISNPSEWKEFLSQEKKKAKEKKKELKGKTPTPPAKKIFVLDFEGDVQASAVTPLRQQISLLIQIAKPGDEVILRLESAGGVVHGYGLCASQLARLRQAQLALTICVDKVAASGGYMMACLGHRIVCAPFAILGSIGVVAQIPNLNRLLKHNHVDFLEMTAGEYKRTVTMLGEVTEKGKDKFQSQLEETHHLFKEHIKTYRPHLNMEEVSKGEYWYGTQALALKLVDDISTSDDVLLKAIEEGWDVYHVHTPQKEGLKQKLAGFIEYAWNLKSEKETSAKVPLLQ